MQNTRRLHTALSNDPQSESNSSQFFQEARRRFCVMRDTRMAHHSFYENYTDDDIPETRFEKIEVAVIYALSYVITPLSYLGSLIKNACYAFVNFVLGYASLLEEKYLESNRTSAFGTQEQTIDLNSDRYVASLLQRTTRDDRFDHIPPYVSSSHFLDSYNSNSQRPLTATGQIRR